MRLTPLMEGAFNAADAASGKYFFLEGSLQHGQHSSADIAGIVGIFTVFDPQRVTAFFYTAFEFIEPVQRDF